MRHLKHLLNFAALALLTSACGPSADQVATMTVAASTATPTQTATLSPSDTPTPVPPTPTLAPTAVGGGGGLILFDLLHGDSGSEIYVASSDGKFVNKLADGTAPQWSPDGRKIAFGSGAQLKVMNSDGTSSQVVSELPGTISDLKWSPNGEAIATLVGQSRFEGDLYTTSLTNGEVSVIGYNIGAFEWSPRGDSIAFLVQDRFSPLVVIKPDGSARTEVALRVVTQFGFDWSPDGQKLLYMAECVPCHLFEVNADGSASVELMPGNTFYPEYMEWSPDGQRIVFGSNGPGNVYVINADGTLTVRISDIPRAKISPQEVKNWSPDGTKILFRLSALDIPATGSDALGSLYVGDPSGAATTQLSVPDGLRFWPLPWSPDSSRIAAATCNTASRASSTFCNVFVIDTSGAGNAQLTQFDTGTIYWISWQP